MICQYCGDTKICQHCRGSGDDPDAATMRPQPCSICDGSGTCPNCGAFVNLTPEYEAGNICPYCGSDDVEDIIDYLAAESSDIFRCRDCQNTWESHPPSPSEGEGPGVRV